jgi:hypothetical protein
MNEVNAFKTNPLLLWTEPIVPLGKQKNPDIQTWVFLLANKRLLLGLWPSRGMGSSNSSLTGWQQHGYHGNQNGYGSGCN